MSRGPRFIFYTNEVVGLGHLRRQLALADRLATVRPDASSLIVTASPVEPYFRLPPGTDVVKLPVRVRDDDGTQRGLLPIPLGEVQSLRGAIAAAASEALRPDVAVVEKLPTGVSGELIRTLKTLKKARAKVVLGLRDIDDSPDRVRAKWDPDLRGVLERFYDAILVYGPPGCPDSIQCLGWHDLGVPVHHVGYVSALPAPEDTLQAGPAGAADPGSYVLATVGSGRSGFRMLAAFLGALALAPLPCPALVVTGPLMDPEEKAELRRLATGLDVEVWDFRTDITNLITGACGIVGMAGYNTVAEFIRARKPALVVPRVRPSEEQLIRARYLQERGLATMIHPDELTPATMRDGLERLLDSPPPLWQSHHFEGTEQAATILSGLAGEPSDATGSRARELAPVPRLLPRAPAPDAPLAVWGHGATAVHELRGRGAADLGV